MRSRCPHFLLAGLVAGGTIAAAPGAAAQVRETGTTGPAGAETLGTTTEPAPASIRLHVSGIGDGEVGVGGRVRAEAIMRPFVAGEKLVIKLTRNGHTVKRTKRLVNRIDGTNAGHLRLRSPELVKAGRYRVRAFHRRSDRQQHDTVTSRRFRISYPDLDPGDRGEKVRIFQRVLDRAGYYTSHGGVYNDAVERAVMAYRKTNNLSRIWNATRSDFRTLAAGRGRFNLEHPGAGRHVEVDISRQVMVLADNGRPQHVFHVSTGAPGTPTIRGRFEFYLRQPGYNSKEMYYSVYFRGGYAIHGYKSVPTYPASHGCVRNPIPNSVFIYSWVRIGMPIYVYS